MLPVVLIALLTTNPPLVAAPEQSMRAPLVQAPDAMGRYPQPPVATGSRYARAPVRPPPEPLPPAKFGLFFAPLSLFSLTFWIEGDLAVIDGLDVFANVGGGPLGQFGFDVGLRYYVLGTSLDGFYVDVRGSAFSLPASNLWMAGPGLMLGYGWRIKRFTLSIALGVTTWYGIQRSNGVGTFFFGSAIVDADVIAFPGVTQPPMDRPGVQPTVRVSLGPWF